MRTYGKIYGKVFVLFAVFTALILSTERSEAVVGIPDQIPAATLLVPFFEVGVSSTDETLLVIANQGHTDSILHCEIWDRDGNFQVSQNISIDNHSEWHISMSNWLNALEVTNPGVKANLQVGDYYWGYITFDSVTASTLLHPYDASYPFADNNDFTGWIYYVDLLQGKSNGICMVPIEAVTQCVSATTQIGFYDDANDISREQVDGFARHYAQYLTTGGSYSLPNYVEMFGRFFQNADLQGETRMIIWRYLPEIHGANSIECDYAYIKSETGNVAIPTISLEHVVDVIDIGDFTNPADYPAGWIYLQLETNLTTHPTGHEIYAFTINSANLQASLNWMAIFEMQIDAY